MKVSFFYFIGSSFLCTIVYLLFFSHHHDELTQKEINTLDLAFNQAFKKAYDKQKHTKNGASQQVNKKNSSIKDNSLKQSILAIIYQKKESTWFIKAKANQKKIQIMAQKFKDLFLTHLTFSSDHVPNFSHISEKKMISKESSRYATFIIDGVEVSVSQFPPHQDISANINRWLNQLKLDLKTPIIKNFHVQKKATFIIIPKQTKNIRSLK
jgi:hypothetical protein